MAQNARILLFYCVLYQCIHSFVFPEMAGRGALATPLNPPLINEVYVPQNFVMSCAYILPSYKNYQLVYTVSQKPFWITFLE